MSQAPSNGTQDHVPRRPFSSIPGLGNLSTSTTPDAPMNVGDHRIEADAEAGTAEIGYCRNDLKPEHNTTSNDASELPLEQRKPEAVEAIEHQDMPAKVRRNVEQSQIEPERVPPISVVQVDTTIPRSVSEAVDDDEMSGGLRIESIQDNLAHEQRTAEPLSAQELPTTNHDPAPVITGTLNTSDRLFLEAAMANKGSETAEWQFDSSDAESSATSDSSDESSSDDEEVESEIDDYELLSPEEQARILMREEGGGSDDGRGGKKPGPNSGPRTANEVKETVVERPNVTVTPEMELLELGTANTIVENFIVVKATTSGETQVLDIGSVLCLADRTVIGAVADLLGRTDTPHYSVAFTNAAEIARLGISLDTKIYYVKDHSSYVFTQPLRLKKYTDASNINDEEVAEHEMEFSDDEAEAEYKRQKKMEKRAKFGIEPKGRLQAQSERPPPETQYPDAGIRYDDDDEDENLYTPLARPPGGSSMALPPRPPVLQTSPPHNGSWERGRGGRGRADRGRRDRGGRNDRGRGRGDSRQGSAHGKSYGQPSYGDRAQNQASPTSPQQAYGNGFQTQGYTPAWQGSAPTTTGQSEFRNYANTPTTQYNSQAQFWNQMSAMQANSQMPSMMPAFQGSSIPSAIPAGSFINPNFFRNQQLGNMASQNGYNSQQQQQQQQQQFTGPQQRRQSQNWQQNPQQFRGQYQGNG